MGDNITGLHHITVIAGDPQENLDFYVGVLGMRLVKKTVNQDVPGTYHLFYADGAAHAGTDLTFFPWPDMAPGQAGVGLTVEVALAVPAGSLGYWAERLTRQGVETTEPGTRFGERLLTFADPHGLRLALVETTDARDFTPWGKSVVPETHQVRGLHGVRLLERNAAPTTDFLVNTLGFQEVGEEDGWRRFALPGGLSGRVVDVKQLPHRAPGHLGNRKRAPRRLAGPGRPDPAQGAGPGSSVRGGIPPRSSIVSGSSRCTSRSRAACCSRLPPMGRGLG